MTAWDLVTEAGQENIAQKNRCMLPGSETKTLIYMKKTESMEI